MAQTIPSGSDPAFVDWCIISSNWNVFEPGAAHTKTKKNERSEKTKLAFQIKQIESGLVKNRGYFEHQK